ncbi:MAG TPA: hypothetical protein VIM48_04960, partial [Chthoniobacterales bacterium]
MRLRSFDVFDTVLARTVAFPIDLFHLCARRLRVQGLISCPDEEFTAYRIAAERQARDDVSHAEPGFQEIYDLLAVTFEWSPSQRDAAAVVELDCESENLCIVPSAAAEVAAARTRGEEIAFISDMYLPAEFLRGILEREGLIRQEERLYVSNEYRAGKSSGKLFEIVRRDFPSLTEWTHVGDNAHSDVAVPQRLGITVAPFDTCHLRQREVFVAGNGDTLWRSQLSAAMRLARLTAPAPQSPPWEEATGAVGPILLSYVHWVLQKAASIGLSRLYFLSRDGEILCKIASILCEEWGYDVECRYLYGSRQAWHAACVADLGDFEKKWILEPDIPLSLEVIALRLSLSPLEFTGSLAAAGLKFESVHEILDSRQLAELWSAMGTPELLQLIRKASEEQRRKAAGYLAQEGLLDTNGWALIDVGWHGNMQRSLEKILRMEGSDRETLGLYFGLLGDHADGRTRLAFWNELTGRSFSSKRVTLIEIFTAGTEGPTLGYREEEKWIPEQGAPNKEGAEWGTPHLQDRACQFARYFARSTRRDEANPREMGQLGIELFREICRRPTRAEAITFGSFPHSTDQRETSFRKMLDSRFRWAAFARKAWSRQFYHGHL